MPHILRPDQPLQSGRDANHLFEIASAESTILLLETDLGPAFFDLKSGLAGEILQKFVNFRIPLAIVVPSPARHGDRFEELTREHRNHPVVRFFTSEGDARTWLLEMGTSA
jgi:hypothetical protein